MSRVLLHITPFSELGGQWAWGEACCFPRVSKAQLLAVEHLLFSGEAHTFFPSIALNRLEMCSPVVCLSMSTSVFLDKLSYEKAVLQKAWVKRLPCFTHHCKCLAVTNFLICHSFVCRVYHQKEQKNTHKSALLFAGSTAIITGSDKVYSPPCLPGDIKRITVGSSLERKNYK